MYFIKHRKFVHWIAALAILLGTLAPAVSQALSLASNGQGFVVEICTTSGSKMTQVIGGNETSSLPEMTSHCPYCVVQPIYLLPSITAFEFGVPRHYVDDVSPVFQAPRILPAWLNLPSRAPPIQS